MDARAVLLDGFERVRHVVEEVCADASADDLTYRPDPDANTIAWLLWHLARVIDSQVADVAGVDEAWPRWFERFALPFDLGATGYGQTTDEVGRVVASTDDLLGYYRDVHALVVAYVSGVDESELDRIVDRSWDPPVSAGVRLVSCIEDGLQHAGQAAYVLGIARRARHG